MCPLPPAVLLVAALLVAPVPAAAQAPLPPVLDLAALPRISPEGRTAYAQHFLPGNLPRAFAIGSNGGYGGQWGAGSGEQARVNALQACVDNGGSNCALYAEDLDVVWPGRKRVPHAHPSVALPAGEGWAFVVDDRYFWLGPKAARGVVVFAHGYSGSEHMVEQRGAQPPPYIRFFNNAGFDVVRFAREWRFDYRSDEMAEHLRDGLGELRRRGWRRVIVAGQARGAWNGLEVLDMPGVADVVIAVSPVAGGSDAAAQPLMDDPALWTITGNARAALTRVAFVQFLDDPSVADADNRVATLRRLQGRVAALLVIDRPNGLRGQNAGSGSAFADRYGACLLRFATAPAPPEGC